MPELVRVRAAIDAASADDDDIALLEMANTWAGFQDPAFPD
jgi:hypothetical protein